MKRPPTLSSVSTLGVPAGAPRGDGLGAGVGVRWIYAGVDAPAIGQADVTAVTGETVALALDDRGPFRVGARLVLELREAPGPRWVAVVTSVAGRAVEVRLQRAVFEERREYPRLQGEIPLRYRVSTGAEAEAAWVGGEPIAGAVRQPSPRMEFSVTGLAFEDEPRARAGDTLLMEIGIAGGPRRWRCVARVVRVLPIADAHAPHPHALHPPTPAATHRIAVEFERIPEAATLALVAYTSRLQQALLEGP